jgi:hypothetical protein
MREESRIGSPQEALSPARLPRGGGMPGRGVQGRGPAGGTNPAGAARRALGQVRAAHTYRRAQRRGHAERDPPGTRRRAARLRERRCARRPPVRSEATQPDDGAVVSAMIGQAVSWSPLESGMDAQRRRGTGRREADPEGAKRSSPVRAARRQPARAACVSGAQAGAYVAMPWQVNSVNLPRDERRRRSPHDPAGSRSAKRPTRRGRWSRGASRTGRSEAATTRGEAAR